MRRKPAKPQNGRHDELARFLTPGELQEFEMRNTGTADLLRDRLSTFNPSPEEFKAIFDLQNRYHNANVDFSFNEINDQAFQEKVKAVLTPERYEDYRRAYDSS